MRWKLSCAGLIIFPVTGAYCLMAYFLAASFADFVDGPGDSPRGMSDAYGYAVGAVLSLLGFLACLIILMKTRTNQE